MRFFVLVVAFVFLAVTSRFYSAGYLLGLGRKSWPCCFLPTVRTASFSYEVVSEYLQKNKNSYEKKVTPVKKKNKNSYEKKVTPVKKKSESLAKKESNLPVNPTKKL
jgi:hypothetical protein